MIYLGVDGGGTKTAFALVSLQGKILAYFTAGTSHPDQIGVTRVQDALRAGVIEVCNQAGISPDRIAFSFWGLPGFGENLAHVPVFEEIVRSILGTNNFLCGNDVEAGWAGSLACQPGIHLVAGTGAIGFGKDPDGNTARSSGWSELFGDEGSAHWLATNLLGLFSKQSDHRLPRTPLYELVKEALGLDRDLDLMSKLDILSQRDEMAKLAVIVHKAALAGDGNAVSLFKEAAREHSLTVKAIIRQLNFAQDRPIQVSYSGGVFKSGEFILEPLSAYLAPMNAVLVKPRLTPIMGACLYAMILDCQARDEEIIHRLQEEEKVYMRN